MVFLPGPMLHAEEEAPLVRESLEMVADHAGFIKDRTTVENERGDRVQRTSALPRCARRALSKPFR